ncbi:hypothetical protein OCU04_009232 [Sclerotinia nivalis]|uniref:Uncharacterized protein n=1 Tax=Sclerotinia nivalis TaxID=352851 RepID=A0A9X0AH47_9HELO|nr:hypothetical protein OCU04_009232 [Sclerotinia nivalis]
MVLYNATLAAVRADQNPVLFIDEQQLLPFCHNPLQLALIVLPGRSVPFVRNRISPAQVRTMHPLYINVLLIQSCGRIVPNRCRACRRRGLMPFLECRRVAGYFRGCCGNCKWYNHVVCCSVREGGPEDSGKRNIFLANDGNRDDNDDDDNVAPGGGAKQNQLVLGSRKAPLLIE